MLIQIVLLEITFSVFELNSSFISIFYLALFKTYSYYVFHYNHNNLKNNSNYSPDKRCSLFSHVYHSLSRFLSNNLFVHFTQYKCYLATTYNYSWHSLKRKSVEYAFLYTFKVKHIVQNALTHPS